MQLSASRKASQDLFRCLCAKLPYMSKDYFGPIPTSRQPRPCNAIDNQNRGFGHTRFLEADESCALVTFQGPSEVWEEPRTLKLWIIESACLGTTRPMEGDQSTAPGQVSSQTHGSGTHS